MDSAPYPTGGREQREEEGEVEGRGGSLTL